MDEGVLITNGTERLFANDAYVRIWGYESKEAALAEAAFTGLGSEPRSHVLQRLSTWPPDDTPAQLHIQRPDGGMRWLETSHTQITYKGKLAYCVVFRDVTDTLHARRELREREEQYAAVVDNMTEAVTIIAGNKRLFVNQPFLDLYGYASAEAALADSPYDNLMPKYRERFERTGTLYELGKPFSEFDIRRLDGALRHLEGSRTDINFKGEPAWLIVLRDATARIQMETAKNQFLAMTSHELRSPLTSIHATTKLVAAGTFGELPEGAKAAMDIVAANSDRLIALVRDILDLERMTLGCYELNAARCDAAKILVEAADLIRPVADDSGIAIVTGAMSASCECDEARVIQVLTNLIGNAIKYSSAGTEIAVTNRLVGDAVEFSVADQGHGIAPEGLERVFVQFQQVDSSDSRRTQGTGLGLAIVEQHGGRIWAESTLGEGSTFRFVLPLTRTATIVG
jgi:PAS domain S-box-containing protein